MTSKSAAVSGKKVAPMKKPAGQHEAGGKTSAQLDKANPHIAGPHQSPSDTSIEDHVAEHGPATHVMHAHDEVSGKHHVTTHHGGLGENMHHSEHESHQEAHEHMGKAMGGDLTEETPDEATGKVGDDSDEGYMQGSKIPGLV